MVWARIEYGLGDRSLTQIQSDCFISVMNYRSCLKMCKVRPQCKMFEKIHQWRFLPKLVESKNIFVSVNIFLFFRKIDHNKNYRKLFHLYCYIYVWNSKKYSSLKTNNQIKLINGKPMKGIADQSFSIISLVVMQLFCFFESSCFRQGIGLFITWCNAVCCDAHGFYL